MGKTSYKSSWEASYKWFTSVKNDVYSGYCKICKKAFRTDGSGWSQVQAHARGNKHLALDPETKDKSQRTLVVVEGNEVELSKNDIVLKPEDQITKTEILNNYMLYIIIIHLRVQRMIAKYMQLCFRIQK